MSGRPLEELNGRTTLEVAMKPNMDEIAKKGVIGTAMTIPKGMTPASDVANLSILGYDAGYACHRFSFSFSKVLRLREHLLSAPALLRRPCIKKRKLVRDVFSTPVRGL